MSVDMIPGDFDTVAFEAAMLEGMALQRANEHAAALAVRTHAFGMAPSGSVYHGRAARDVSASYDRLGDTPNAHQYAAEALSVHSALLSYGDESVRRERGVSAMQLGSILLRKAVAIEEAKEEPVVLARTAGVNARSSLERARKDLDKRDQYFANMIGRRALVEGLFGNKANAVGLSLRAVGYAAVSESPRFLTNTEPSLSAKDRVTVRSRGLARAGVALTVAGLNYAEKVVQKVAHKSVRPWQLKLANRAL